LQGKDRDDEVRGTAASPGVLSRLVGLLHAYPSLSPLFGGLPSDVGVAHMLVYGRYGIWHGAAADAWVRQAAHSRTLAQHKLQHSLVCM
jgi:hypothetical protein